LLRENYTTLASRLLGELEVALAARRRFRHHFLRRMNMPGKQALRLLVSEWSWDGAVDHDSQIAIALQSAAVERRAKFAEDADVAPDEPAE
ncbi:MAG TPA: hypothetical protein VF911_12720, partial [Thermoanaerobaculia bacterium]